VLLERWINYKNEEAERLNQQNALGKDPRMSQQEQQVVLLLLMTIEMDILKRDGFSLRPRLPKSLLCRAGR